MAGAFSISLHRASIARARKAHTERQLLAFALVIEHVHPDNLGALPPSPEKLRFKAQQIGLLSTFEACEASHVVF